jgi:hypothetical protein
MSDKTNDQNTHNDQRSMSGLVLVTGAAGGQQGKTGRHTQREDDQHPAHRMRCSVKKLNGKVTTRLVIPARLVERFPNEESIWSL